MERCQSLEQMRARETLKQMECGCERERVSVTESEGQKEEGTMPRG